MATLKTSESSGVPSDAIPEGGNRTHWNDLPIEVRDGIHAALGSDVVGARSHSGGFSPGFASTLTLRSGERVFVKAVSASANSESVEIYGREARIAASLPDGVPAPALLAQIDVGDWIALAFEHLDGAPPRLPWSPANLELALEAMGTLAEVSTAGLDRATFRPIADSAHSDFAQWRMLAGGDAAVPQGLDPWALDHLDELARCEESVGAALSGESLCHGDIRNDNMMLTPSSSTGGAPTLWLVDWPWAALASPEADLVMALPAMLAAYPSGTAPDPEELLRRAPSACHAEPESITAILVGITGFFAVSGLLPPVPSIPRLRAFQLAQARAGVEWLKRRLG